MQNQVQVFQSEEFGKVRVIEKDGHPWFVGKDVVKLLGYENGSRDLKRHVDEEDRQVEMIPQYRNGTLLTKALIINESGLYSLILSSKLPTAKAFKRWVTSEVLPSIRAHGAYINPKLLEKMQESLEFAEDILERLATEYAKNRALADYANALIPKAAYYDDILQSTKAMPVSIIAKDYGMTAIEFNRMLHELGVQYKVGGTWLLYKEYTSKGYTVSKTYRIGGEVIVHTCWTQKGRMFLYDFLVWHGIYPNVNFSHSQAEVC